MAVTAKELAGLKRELVITIEASDLQKKYDASVKKAAKTANISGFRKGKVPPHIIESKFGKGIWIEEATNIADEIFKKHVKDDSIQLAGQPQMTDSDVNFKVGEPVTLTIIYEVYPTIELQDLQGKEVAVPLTEVTDADIDKVIENIRKQQSDWTEVKRAAQDSDKVNIDFTGFLDGEAFPGGAAEKHELVLGSNTMIPGFEAGIMGMQAGEEKDINVTFPEEYHSEDLSGKDVVFKIKLHEVLEQQLPELDDALAEKMKVEGGVAGLREQVRKNLEAQVKKTMQDLTKKTVFAALADNNQIELPEAAVEKEIEYLQKVASYQVAQREGMKDVPKLDLPREPFLKEAQERVRTGLLIAEVIKLHDIKLDKEKLNSAVELMSQNYEQPEMYARLIRENENMMAQMESDVLEQQVVDKLLEDATIKSESMSCDDLMKKSQED